MPLFNGKSQPDVLIDAVTYADEQPSSTKGLRDRGGRDRIYSFIEKWLKRLRGKETTIDRQIPLQAFLSSSVRRCTYALRGILFTSLFKLRPQLVFVGPRVSIRNASLCHFGRQVTIEVGTLIDGLSSKGVHLGNNVILGAHTIVRSSSMQGLGSGLIMGANSSCDAWCFFGAGGLITIGHNVIMGQHTSFHAETHRHNLVELPIRAQGITYVPIVVEENCWIGANVTFLGGAYVGRGSIVGAGSVVRDVFAPYSIIAGVPARLIRSRLNEDQP